MPVKIVHSTMIPSRETKLSLEARVYLVYLDYRFNFIRNNFDLCDICDPCTYNLSSILHATPPLAYLYLRVVLVQRFKTCVFVQIHELFIYLEELGLTRKRRRNEFRRYMHKSRYAD